MRNFMLNLGLWFSIFTASFVPSIFAKASIPVEQAATEKKDHYLKEGVFVGGFDQGAMILANVRHSYTPENHMERLVLDLAPENSPGHLQRPGFFHVAIQGKGRAVGDRLVIDLANCKEAKVTAQQVSKVLSQSHFFASAIFTFDEESSNLTIEVPIKTPAEFEIFELASDKKPGRIVIDVKNL